MSPLVRQSMNVVFLLMFAAGLNNPVRAQGVTPPTQEEVDAARSAPLFASHGLLEITLEADFQALRKEDRSRDSREDRPAVMAWSEPGGGSNSLDIQLRTRGNFRLSSRNCDFPPLRLRIKKGVSEGTLFQGQPRLKLVVACKLRQDYWEQYVLSEYLAYRTLNALTDRSFQVRLARVTYVDTSGRDDPFTRYAFLIEPDENMALRNQSSLVGWSTGQFDPRLVDKRQAILAEVFQYMIGNTDWSGVEMHNMVLIRDQEKTPYTVPYDFDFSGLVNARYATVDPSLKINRVRERLFRGFCPQDVDRSQADYDAVYELFRERKDDIYELWGNLEGLDQKVLKETLKYFDEFYATINDPGRLEARMMKDCRRMGS